MQDFEVFIHPDIELYLFICLLAHTQDGSQDEAVWQPKSVDPQVNLCGESDAVLELIKDQVAAIVVLDRYFVEVD